MELRLRNCLITNILSTGASHRLNLKFTFSKIGLNCNFFCRGFTSILLVIKGTNSHRSYRSFAISFYIQTFFKKLYLLILSLNGIAG